MSKPYNGFRALRPDYLELCDGNACAALLLDLFAYLTQVRTSNNEQAQSGGKEGNDLWFYRSLADLHADLYGAFGRAAIRTGLQVLTEGGLIESRANPAKPWDRTLQYRTLHGAKPNDVERSESNDDAGARPSRPSDAQSEDVQERKEETSSKLDKRDEQQTAESLIDYWKARCQHPTAKSTRERKQKVQARLREGYSADEIRTAIDGAAVGAFVNDVGKRFDDLELICRTGSKLESFIDRAAAAPVRNGTVHPIRQQPNGKPSHDQLLAELRAANPRLQAEAARQLPPGM